MFVHTEEKICMDLAEFSELEAFRKTLENIYNDVNDEDLLDILHDLMENMDKFKEYIETV